MIEIIPTRLPGCLKVQPRIHRDARGSFVKIFEERPFAERGLPVNFKESFYSTSHRGVLRGLHFQVPPHDGAKLVYCISGEVLDVALDLRAGSPTYGQHELFTLSSVNATALYLPSGFAHGFLTRSDYATLVYHVASEHSAAHDMGVLWSSAGIPWPEPAPTLSERDQRFTPLAEFKTPFQFAPPKPLPEGETRSC